MGISISDHVAGIYAVTGILAALRERDRTGRGARIEVPLLSSMISLLSYEAAWHLYSGEVPGPVGSGHRSLIPYNAVRTLDGHIVIDAHLPKFWSALCRVLERVDLEGDPRFADLPSRGKNREALLGILDETFARKSSFEWLERLDAAGVPCAPINDLRGALEDPGVLALGMVREIEHKGAGLRFKAPGNPIRSIGEEVREPLPPPLLGEHTEAVLRDLLGYDAETVARLEAAGVAGISSRERQE
jgi:crotonobetainyl-CoA:carnitine CoA-transferase CaiB-like acyl-CoA transferase